LPAVGENTENIKVVASDGELAEVAAANKK